jgi:putative tricarboxylic transport membrane protein
MTQVLCNKDFWSGVMLIVIGGVALVIARDYPLGTTLRMGPGYFPGMLGGLLVIGGLYLAIKGTRSSDMIEGGLSLRALILLPLSLVLFGFLMEHAGFVPAIIVLIVGSAAAGNEFKLIEVLWFAALLTILCIAVFIWGLGLPYPLLAEF